MGERTEAYDREKLYDEVWKEPALVVAKRYGVSSVALAKACRKLSVPLPPRGYWARIQAGRKAPPRPPLPRYDPSSRTQSAHRAPGESDGASSRKNLHEEHKRGSATPTVSALKTSDAPSRTERKATEEPKQRKRRKTSPEDIPEYLYCTIDSWQRTFRFGVNRLPIIKGFLEKEGGFDEWDQLEVFGVVRYHQTSKRKRKRTGQKVELWVFPQHTPRKDWRDDPERIGGVWTQEGKLFGSCHIPADTSYSLFPCLEANRFKELEIRIREMHHRRGKIDGIEFAPEETPMEDLQQ